MTIFMVHRCCDRYFLIFSTAPFTTNPSSSFIRKIAVPSVRHLQLLCLSWTDILSTSVDDPDTLTEKNSSTGCEPNMHFIAEIYLKNTQETLNEQRFPDDFEHDDATIGQTLLNACRRRADHSGEEDLSSCLSLSVSHDWTVRPVVCQLVSSDQETKTQLWEWTDQDSLGTTKRADSRFLSSGRFENTNPGRLRWKKFSKVVWNYWVGRRRNLSSSRRRTTPKHSTRLRGENCSKIKMLSLCSLARFRNYRMKTTAWMIWEIFQDAESVRNGQVPIYQSTSVFPQTSRSWWIAKPFSGIAELQKWAAKHLGHMVHLETFLKIQPRLLQHLIRKNWIHGVLTCRKQFTHQRRRMKHHFRIRDASPNRQPKLQSSLLREDLQRNVCATETAGPRSSFWQLPCTSCQEYISNFRKLAAKIVCLQHECQHEQWGQQAWHEPHQQQVHEHLHEQIAQPVSIALGARSHVTPLDVVSHAPHGSRCSKVSSHPHGHPCAFLFDLTFFSTLTWPSPSFSTSPSSYTPSSMLSSTTWSPCNTTCPLPRRGNDANDVHTSLAGYEPIDMVFNELSNSQGSFSHVAPSSDLDTDDAFGKLFDEAYQKCANYRNPEGVSVSQSSLSLVFDRTGKLVEERNVDQSIGFGVTRNTCSQQVFCKHLKLRKWSIEQNLWGKAAQRHRSGLCLMNRWFSQSAARKLVITNSKQLEQNKNAKFYKKNYGVSKRIFVKFINKILQRWWNCQNSRVLPSIRSQDGSSSRTRTLLWNYQEEYKNYTMKYFVWTILRTSRALNQFAVEIPTLPVDQCHSLHIRYQKDCWGLPSYRSAAKKGRHIWDTHGISGNVFANPHASSSAPCPQELNPWRTTIEEPLQHVCSGEKWKTRTKSRSEMPSLDRQPKIQSSSVEETLKRTMGANQQRLQISDLHFDKPATFACWKMRFKCICSQFSTEAMQWIKEVELVDSVDELRSSSSARGISMPNFEVFDARIASGLNKIIHNSQFKRRISLEERKAQKQDRFLRGRQIAYLVYDHFRVTGSHVSVKNYTDLFTIVLRNDDIQEFDSKWDGILLGMTKIPPDDILEGLCKLRIRESEKLKTVLELYHLETHQKKLGFDHHRLKTVVKWSIEQEIRNKNFGARSGNFEKNAVVKNQETEQRVQRILGDCWQWEANGQCVKGDNCSFRHEMNKRGKMTQPNFSLLRCSMREKASRTRSPRGKSPSGRMSRWPFKDHLKGTCNNSFCEKWHPPECLFYKTKSGCQFGKSAHSHIVRLMNSRLKGLRRKMKKVQWPCWRKEIGKKENLSPMNVTIDRETWWE